MYAVGGSEAIARDAGSFLFSSSTNFNHAPDGGEVMKSREMATTMTTADLYHNHHIQQLQQQQQSSGGLMRYSSAPSSLFATLFDGNGNTDGALSSPSSSPESGTFFGKFVESELHQLQYPGGAMKHEITESVHNSVYPSAPAARHDYNSVSKMESPFRGMDQDPNHNNNEVKRSSGHNSSSNLIRQSSSPAGFFATLTTENGYAVMNEMENFRASAWTNAEASSSTSRFNNHLKFSSGPSSSSRLLPQIDENDNGNMGMGDPENGHLENSSKTNGCYVPNMRTDSWNGSTSTVTSLKRSRDDDLKMFSSLYALDTQNGETGQFTPSLAHHLSLSKTSSEIAAVEKYLQFQQDAVPCKIRAKRGFATHPRSIAERVRRTRISARMKKLQELFPNMDKQASTADMLDWAVEYIKDLQKEVQTLRDTRARCTCLRKQEEPSPTA